MQEELWPSLPWPPRALVHRTPGAWHQKQLGRLGGGVTPRKATVWQRRKRLQVSERCQQPFRMLFG